MTIPNMPSAPVWACRFHARWCTPKRIYVVRCIYWVCIVAIFLLRVL